MSFNSSCSYAGLANMLEYYGIETEDRQIALDMGLPFLFSKEENAYSAGPMLQTAEWFHLYLKPRGFRMTETRLQREAVVAVIERAEPEPVSLGGYFQRSLEVLEELKTELTAFCAERRSLKELASARDGLFRAILLDAVTMLELLEETEIRGVLQRLQRQLLEVLKEGKPLILQNRIPVAALGEAIDRYAELIREQIGRD